MRPSRFRMEDFAPVISRKARPTCLTARSSKIEILELEHASRLITMWSLIPFHTRARERQKFHGRFLRSVEFLVQNRANLCNAWQIPFVRLTYDSHAVQNSENVRKN